jgi:hypothetical protein
MNHRTIINIMILVELGLPLLSERHSLIIPQTGHDCATEENIRQRTDRFFSSVCMNVFFEGKEKRKEDWMHCRREEGELNNFLFK